MSTALELDPYVLPVPTSETLVVPIHLVVSAHAHLNSRYDAPVWSLAPLTGNPSESRAAIHWRHCPPEMQREIRLVAWTAINGELRPTFLKERSSRMRARLGSDKIRDTVATWMHLATWLAERGMSTLADCSTEVLHDYGLHLRTANTNRQTVAVMLVALTRLWAFDRLSGQPAGVGRPPWDEVGADDYLPAASSTGGENATEPVAEQTMGPLLIWAIRVVDDLADDILAAWAAAQALTENVATNPAGLDALRAYLMPLISSGAPIPSSRQGAAGLARSYICGITGASQSQLEVMARREGLTTLAAQRPGGCPLDVTVTGQIAGRPWRSVLHFDEAAMLGAV